MKNLGYFFLFLLFTNFALGQNENKIWYFGNNAGLDFNSVTPVALTNGALDSYEGCASVADGVGNLLFYTDGVTVWNHNHTPMPNGTGLFGNTSTSQSAVIVALPGNPSIYYIFTQDAAIGSHGLCYSIVDITLQGGNGDVTQKNIPLLSNTAEKLTAMQHINSVDYWIISHEWNSTNFYSFLLTSAGITGFPVISSTGSYYGITGNDFIGCLKASHNGAKLAAAFYGSGFMEIYDFDNLTGQVSNPVTSGNFFSGAYGVEFSPDDSKLYLSKASTSSIYQFDMLAGSGSAILASAIIAGISSLPAFNLQLAPDGRIYISRNNSEYLAAILYPDSSGTSCQYTDSAIYLNGKKSSLGLPNFIPTSLGKSLSISNTCYGDTAFFTLYGTSNLMGAQWNFGDSLSGLNNLAYTFNTQHIFTSPGNYMVQIIRFLANGNTDTTSVQIVIGASPQVSLGSDTSFCLGSHYLLHVASGYSSYLWQDNSTDSVFSAASSGTYWVTVTDNGCSSTDSITLNVIPCNLPIVGFNSSDTVFCDKKCLDFTDLSTNNPTSWLWSFPGAVPAVSTDQHPTNICYNAYGSFDVSLIACNGTGCDTLFMPAFITEYQLPAQPAIIQSNDTLYSSPAFSYAWYNASNPGTVISTMPYLVIQAGGDYFVIAGDSIGCKNSSSLFFATHIDTFSDQENIDFIYPNPVADKINIDLQGFGKNKTCSLVILNVTGQPVLIKELRESHNMINLKGISNGIYFVHLKTANAIINKKIIINH